jgi:anti-anti-sigma regulatory factor
MPRKGNALTRRRVGDQEVIILPNEPSPDLEDSLLSAAKRILRESPGRIVLDLSRVVYINTAGIGLLVVLVRDRAVRQAGVVIAGATGQPALVLQHVGFDKFARMVASVEEACSEDAGSDERP